MRIRILLLFPWITSFVYSYPSFHYKPNLPINDLIRSYERAEYDHRLLSDHHARRKRNSDGGTFNQNPLKFNITTKDRIFSLVLRPDNGLFAEDAVFEGGQGEITFDRAKAYVGTLEDDERVEVSGIITKDGLFDGTISTPSEEYYVEPSSRYADGKSSSGRDYHTVIYKVSDVVYPSGVVCGGRSITRDENQNGGNNEKINNKRKRRRKKREANGNGTGKDFTDGIYYDLDMEYDNENKFQVVEDDNGYVKVKIANTTIITKPKYKVTANDGNNKTRQQLWQQQQEEKANKARILIGGSGGGEKSSEPFQHNFVVTSEDEIEYAGYPLVGGRMKRPLFVDAGKTTCMLYLQADHLFFEKFETEETCIDVMTRHVQRVNTIYRNTDFNQDGKPDNIGFMIKRVKVHASKDSSYYRFPGNYGVEKFLEIFSEDDYDAFCLAYMFTYRDFEMGTLGLAWTGDLKNAGGVCEKNGHYRGSLKSLNSGIVTLLNYGKPVPSAVSHVTLAHEIGHNFGSPHDPESCTPGGDNGNYIMFARATSGDKRNNYKFSTCSLASINPVLNVKARSSSRGCFTEPQSAICGNGVVEQGEDCDCGWEEDCKDTCCYPQRKYPPIDEMPCRLAANAICSPSQGPCCTSECVFKKGDLCRTDNGCRDASYCDGATPRCPPSTNKPNKTVCNKEYVCYNGECTGSICLAYGLESCQCMPVPGDAPTKPCELCCKIPGERQPCFSSFQWNVPPHDVPDMFAKPGTPCNDYNGYCDVFKKCREVDPSGPLATLRRLLLSEKNIACFKKWALDHWYFTSLFFGIFLMILVLSGRMLKKKPKKVPNPNHTPRPRPIPGTDGRGVAVVVHPVAVRKKLPLNKKVRENRHKVDEVGGGAAIKYCCKHRPPNYGKNDNSNKNGDRNDKKDDKSDKRLDKNDKKSRKNEKKSEKTDKKKRGRFEKDEAAEEEAVGKVRNWLLTNEQQCSGGGGGVAAGLIPNQKRAAVVKTMKGEEVVDKKEETQMKLQVVYKPPFKFSVKFGKNSPEATNRVAGDVKKQQQKAVQGEAGKRVRVDRVRKADGDSKVLYRRSISAPAEALYENTDRVEILKGDRSGGKEASNDHNKDGKDHQKEGKDHQKEGKDNQKEGKDEPLYTNLMESEGLKRNASKRRSSGDIRHARAMQLASKRRRKKVRSRRNSTASACVKCVDEVTAEEEGDADVSASPAKGPEDASDLEVLLSDENDAR